MRKHQAFALVMSLGLSLAISPTVQAKTSISKPSAPTVVSISSSAPKKGKVNVTVSIALPTSDGGSKITGSKVTGGGKSCTIKKLRTSCTLKGIKSGKSLNVVASSKNKKGFGTRSQTVKYVAGEGNFSVASPSAPPTASPITTPTQTIVDTPRIIWGDVWTGIEEDGNARADYWAAVRYTNSSSLNSIEPAAYTSIFSSNGAVIHSSWDLPADLPPSGSGWWVTTCMFCAANGGPDAFSQVSTFNKPDKISLIGVNEFPSVSNATVVTHTLGGNRKMVTANIRNNHASRFLSASVDVVMLNQVGVPVYAFWGSMPGTLIPGGSSNVNLVPYLSSGFTFPAGVEAQVASVQITISPTLCTSPTSSDNCI